MQKSFVAILALAITLGPSFGYAEKNNDPVFDDGKTEIKMDDQHWLIIKGPTSQLKIQLSTAPTGTAVLIGTIAQMVKEYRTKKGIDGGNALTGTVLGAVSLFGGVSYVAKASGNKATASDPIRQFRKTPQYATLVKNLGKDKAENLILDMYANRSFESLADKYLDDRTAAAEIKTIAAAERKDLDKALSPQIADADERTKLVEGIVGERAFLRLVASSQNDPKVTKEIETVLHRQKSALVQAVTPAKAAGGSSTHG